MIQKKKCTKCGQEKSLSQFILLKDGWLSRKCRKCKETKKFIQTGLINLKIEIKVAEYDSIRSKAVTSGFSVKNYIMDLHRKNMEK